jgi:flagellar hook assembly protein FlgD
VNFTKTDKTTIAYTVEEECNVYICLYTLSGDLMKVLVNNKTQAPGKYYIDWYGDNDGGAKVASGVYLYIAKIGNDVIRKKIVLLR